MGMVLVALLFAVPLPHYAVVQGVVWLPEEAIVRAPQPGRIVAQHVAHGTAVTRGALLFTVAAPDLEAEAKMRAARLARAEAQYAAARAEGQAGAGGFRDRVTEAGIAMADAEARLAQLSVRADLPGRLDLAMTAELEGRFFARGDVIGHVLPEGDPVIRVAVSQDLAALIARETRGIALRLAAAPGRILPADVLRVVPAGGDVLPSPVLALEGGGLFATQPVSDGGPLRAATQLFQLDLGMPEGAPRPAYGMRAHVRFTFAPKPLAARAARALRTLFLRNFDV